jgi:3-hydroxy-D-aspartate aldolase
VVELDVMARNIARMAIEARRYGVALRPHAKAHKCGAIARLQVDAGAVGVCCQKVWEAEAMFAAGIKDIYLSNQVIAAPKLDRLAKLARTAQVSLAIDSPAGLEAAARAARDGGVDLTVLIEVDLGDARNGVPPGPALVDLARRLSATGNLRFGGLQAYRSQAQHASTAAERRDLTAAAVAAIVSVRYDLTKAGIECQVVTGGGTGTVSYAASSGVYTELQPGSYIFMDAAYGAIEDESGGPFRCFDTALFVEATVTSAREERAMCDAGAKAVSPAGALPLVVAPTDIVYYAADDEHGRLRWHPGSPGVRVGDRVRLLPDNCDPTVNLHDWIVGARNWRVETVWPIEARGPGL